MFLEYVSLDRSSSVPLYEQLTDSISVAIKNQKLKIGDKLPTENKVIESCGVSRQVVRQAYGELVRRGLIVRERGRGSFVKAQNYGVFLNKMMSFTDELALTGMAPLTRVITFERGSFSDVNIVGSSLGDTEYFHIERLRSANGRPSVHIDTYLPASRYPGLDRFDFANRSLYRTLDTSYGVRPTTSKRSLSAMNAAADIARYLEVSAGKALLVLKSRTYDQDGALMEASIESFDGDSCSYDFDITQ